MAITVVQILTWCRAPAKTRATVTNQLMPGDLSDLGDFSTEEIRGAIKNFARLPANPFLLPPHTLKHLTQLTLWVKDAQRLDEPVSFPNGTTLPQFVAAIDAAQGRERIRKERQKSAESLASVHIVPQLTTSAGWESWSESVKATLTLVYGSKGVPLAYVTHRNNIVLPANATWEERAIATAPHDGIEYEADRMTVHFFYLNNISEESMPTPTCSPYCASTMEGATIKHCRADTRMKPRSRLVSTRPTVSGTPSHTRMKEQCLLRIFKRNFRGHVNTLSSREGPSTTGTSLTGYGITFRTLNLPERSRPSKHPRA
jgi:hypothetical protein